MEADAGRFFKGHLLKKHLLARAFAGTVIGRELIYFQSLLITGGLKLVTRLRMAVNRFFLVARLLDLAL